MRTKGKSSFYKKKSGYKPADTTVVVLTCIPYTTGYYKERLDILKVCLVSIMKHTDVDFDLMVVDNGSTKKVTNFLDRLKREG